MPLTDEQYDALPPSEQLAFRQLSKSKDADERNDAKALMSIGVKNPVTRLRRQPYELEGRLALGTAATAAACALLGAAVGAVKGSSSAGPALGALSAAGIGAGAYILAAGQQYATGRMVGNWEDLDKKRLKKFYGDNRFRWIYDYGHAEAQLEKLRQEHQARRQAAPTQIVL